MDEKLFNYIKGMLNIGYSRETIANYLQKQGYNINEINQAIENINKQQEKPKEIIIEEKGFFDRFIQTKLAIYLGISFVGFLLILSVVFLTLSLLDNDNEINKEARALTTEQIQELSKQKLQLPIKIETKEKECGEKWSCTNWEPVECPELGLQERACTDTNKCNTDINKPIETRGCIPVIKEVSYNEIKIENFMFNPPLITITEGEYVRWQNYDKKVHTITDKLKKFDSGLLDQGGIFVYQFKKEGTYNYYDKENPGLRGRVIVRRKE